MPPFLTHAWEAMDERCTKYQYLQPRLTTVRSEATAREDDQISKELMSKKIEIPIPAIGVDLGAYFQNLVNDEFSGVVNVDAVAQSNPAVLDNIQIGDVTVDGDVVTVEYEYEYSAYLGCKDMDCSAADDNSVNGHQPPMFGSLIVTNPGNLDQRLTSSDFKENKWIRNRFIGRLANWSRLCQILVAVVLLTVKRISGWVEPAR